jgi:sRNA-binding carbon storage regulator CsrA
VNLGIEAPEDVEIWREEIYEKLGANVEGAE